MLYQFGRIINREYGLRILFSKPTATRSDVYNTGAVFELLVKESTKNELEFSNDPAAPYGECNRHTKGCDFVQARLELPKIVLTT